MLCRFIIIMKLNMVTNNFLLQFYKYQCFRKIYQHNNFFYYRSINQFGINQYNQSDQVNQLTCKSDPCKLKQLEYMFMLKYTMLVLNTNVQYGHVVPCIENF